MRTSAAGNSDRSRGFTLIELLVVVAIIAIATAGVSFALRDSQETLLESARAQSRTTGVPVRWHPTAEGFQFEGLPAKTLPERWLSTGTRVQGEPTLVLGPEPIIGRQEIVLASTSAPGRTLHVATDGLRPFRVTGMNEGS